MIDSKTRLLGLIGNPIAHSVSPIFMNYILEKLKINCRYFAFRVDNNKLNYAIVGLKSLGFIGSNVTIPFKRMILDYLDEVDENAEEIGAVNCIHINNDRLRGYNTDYLGFTWPLKEYKGLIKNSDVIIFGCGGAARGVVYALNDLYIRSIRVVNRTEHNAIQFIRWARSILNPSIKIEYLGNYNVVDDSILRASLLIVNTTPLGMSPDIDRIPLKEDVIFSENNIVYDLIYNPWETKLLRIAKKSGAKTINGFPMLIAQGLYSLSIWFPKLEKDIFSLFDEAASFTEKYLRMNDL